ncbi:MAG: L-rhamnose isomerase [Spirochaetota bacterium]
MSNTMNIEQTYLLAREQYAQIGVDTDAALERLNEVTVSLHCWQADDVGGFETGRSQLGEGGIQATGNFHGRAMSIIEMQSDLEKVLSLLPGPYRLNLHAIYGDFANMPVDRNQVEPAHYQGWIDWCRQMGIGMDFNATCFSHPMARSGFTLSSKDRKVRAFWIEHVKRCREIASYTGLQLGTPCIHNLWIPDGSKDIPIDRNGHRSILRESLDEIMSIPYSEKYMKDALESKLFGIGKESMTVGSHDFYMAYAMKANKLICLDNGHFHPTEQVGDKISSCLQFLNEILLHLTRPVRWDSDHVVILDDEIRLIASEIVRNNYLNRVHLGLDYFDASMNRIGAYVIGARAVKKAFLMALLEPTPGLLDYEEHDMLFERLAMLEELKTKPYGAVWDYYCLQQGVPVGEEYISTVQEYDKKVLIKRPY